MSESILNYLSFSRKLPLTVPSPMLNSRANSIPVIFEFICFFRHNFFFCSPVNALRFNFRFFVFKFSDIVLKIERSERLSVTFLKDNVAIIIIDFGYINFYNEYLTNLWWYNFYSEL